MTRKADHAWLFARPIAHRGLHDARRLIVENSLAAARAAIVPRYGVECDVQMTRDEEVFVFHDDVLDRLTLASGRVADIDARTMAMLAFRGGDGAPPTLAAFLAEIDGRVPVVIEIKSRFDGDMRLADRTAAIAERFAGSVALKSFDPAIIAHLRGAGCNLPLGIVAEARYDHAEWAGLSAETRRDLAALSHLSQTKPDFLSWCVNDLPHTAVTLCRHGLGLPVMTWTVRTPAQRLTAATYADQIVFEGFLP